MSEDDSYEDIDEDKFESENLENKKILTQEKVKDRIFPSVLCLTEFVQVVCTRAEQIQRGAKIYINNPSYQPHEIAIQEIIEGCCPLVIYRKRGEKDGKEYVEEWEVNELEITQKCISHIETLLDKNNQINIVEKLNNLLHF